MRVKIFETSWDVELPKMEKEINDFLATLDAGVVKHVNTAMAVSRTGDTDQGQTEYIVTVWYDSRP